MVFGWWLLVAGLLALLVALLVMFNPIGDVYVSILFVEIGVRTA
jgi:uncharacterized membrane protein HdeD (DUF308 family)